MKKIILADDDFGIRDIVKLILEKYGYEIIVFKDGTEIMSGQFEIPDLFLIDKQLPGIDGLDLCRHLKKDFNTRSIPVVMLSASPYIVEMSKSAGADDCLEKPFLIQDLRNIVKKHIGEVQVAG